MDILRSEVIGDLGVITTIEDFHRWDENFYHNRLGAGTQRLIATMLTEGRTNDGEQLSYAFGLRHGSYRGLRTRSHSGSAVGYVADFLQFPDQRFSVVVLSNLRSFRLGQLARQIADLYLADQFTAPPVPRSETRPSRTRPEPLMLSDEALETFAGPFYSDELDFFYSFQVKDGTLQLELRDDQIDLVPSSNDHFAWDRRELHFLRNENGTVSGFTLDAGDERDLKFRKVDNRVPDEMR